MNFVNVYEFEGETAIQTDPAQSLVDVLKKRLEEMRRDWERQAWIIHHYRHPDFRRGLSSSHRRKLLRQWPPLTAEERHEIQHGGMFGSIHMEGETVVAS
jgi:hypothetical protein